MSYSAIGIKFPLATYETIKSHLPEGTVYRRLSYSAHSGFIEIYYVIDSFITTPKQKQWLGDIKVRITKKLSGIGFDLVELEKDTTVIALSGETYNLKSLSDAWRKVKSAKKEIDIFGVPFFEENGTPLKALENKWTDNQVIKDDFADDFIKVPQLVPLTMGGKAHENLYRTLCIYAKRLHYEKLFIFEYMSLAANVYAQDMSLLPKEVLKIAHKAFTFIEEQIKLHPEDFKQKLTQQELQQVKSAHGKRLQKYNQMKRTDNIELVKEAISSGKCLKANGTINVGKVAIATALNRKTVEKILRDNSILP